MTLEEKKKKALEDAFKKTNFQQTTQNLKTAAQSIKPKTNTTKTTAAKSYGSAAKSNTVTQSATKQDSGLSSFQQLANVPKTVQSVGQKVVQNANDMRNLQRNSIMWHGTTDAATRASLNQQNNAIRQRLGLSFDPSTGVTFDSKTGLNYSLPTQMLYGTSAAKRTNTAAQFSKSNTVLGQKSETQRGIDAHKTMADLYSRAAETWSNEDTKNRDNARQALTDEMQNILRQYGLQYSARSTGPNARFTVSDDEAIEKLRAAGADETTLAYVAENIQMREAADRLGQGIEAVGKRFVGSIPALFETSRQQSANVEQSRQNPEYVQLEERAQQLEAQLQSMSSQDADGKVPADYMAVYNEWQDVRNRLNELSVKTPVDQSLWGQTMLREAAEAQTNATAGLAAVPRFLADTGISIAGNVPSMAMSAIPVAGPALGATFMGASAAGQRAAELNAQGVSPGEALGRGISSGIIEAVTEKLPLDEMAKLLNGGGTSAVRNILRQMGIEASEESASYLMNYAVDLAANDPNAEFSFAELAQSALGGALSGGFFGTAGTVIGGMRTRQGPTVDIPGNISTQEVNAGARMAQEAMQKAQREIDQARNIAERFGAKLELNDTGFAGGKYENGVITINPNSSSPIRQVLVHELTHHIETSGGYNDLQSYALSVFSQEQGVTVDVLRNNIMKLYEQNGIMLSADGANRELTAAFCEYRLFQDEASIQRLAQTDITLFQRIRQWIQDAVARLRGTKEQRNILRLQQMYERAARTVGQKKGYSGAQYTIDDSRNKFSTLLAQRAYRNAVERGDIQEAENILKNRYLQKGYSENIDNRMLHSAPNGSDGYSVRFDDVSTMFGDDIYGSFAERYYGTGEDYDAKAIEVLQKAYNNPDSLITVYRAIPENIQDTALRNGDWITTVEEYARDHGERNLGGNYKIISETVPARFLYANGDSIFEFGFDNGMNEVYKNAIGNAKSTGITYDDFARLIPLSMRFDENNPDRRFTFALSPEQIAKKANSQALGRRLAELDAEKRQAETLLPGPIRDRAIQRVQEEMQRVQQETAQTSAPAEQARTAGQNAPNVQVLADAAFQYGLSPEVAMLQAQERARNEAVQEQAEQERADTVSELMQAWTDKRAAEKQAEQTLSGLTLTRRDINMAEAAAKNGMETQKWEQADNPEQAYMYGSALRQVSEADKPIRQYFAERADEMQNNAQEAADWIATFAKDKRFGALYQRETMERNIRDIFGEHTDLADNIIRDYFTPVHKAVAQGNRLKNKLRDRVKALKLNKHESALTQMRLEKEDAAAAEYIQNNKINLTPEMDAKINRAVEEFRSIYNELYNAINRTLLLTGQEPAPFRQNYAPHFVKDTPDTLLGKVRFALGLGKDSSVNIPTDIAGLTDTFRPGKKWFGNLLQREGEITDYDAVAGFDRYVETAADVITLTDSIQKLRALEDQVRYTLSDEGVKAQIDKIKADANLDALAQREQIEKVYDDNRTTVQKLIADIQNQKRMGMGRFVTELRRYTDNLAGKKSREDRGWEDFANRQVYTMAKNLEGRVAANMISLNPGSWLTNFIPITQASGEVSVPNILRGMYQTVKAGIQDDGYVDASAFLTNRYGSQQLDKTLARKVSDISGAPMEIFDHIAANTIHRGKYIQNIENGMNVFEAIEDADAFTASLMADRSKGSLPTIFNATNPVRKIFTMFMTEQNNQLSYLFKDLPKAKKQKGAVAVALAFTNVFVGAHLYNILYRKLVGRDAALDPIGMISRLFGVGDDEDEEKTAAERVTGLVEDIGGQIPFVGGVLFDGGRVPISSAIPNFANLGKAVIPGLFGVEWSGEKRLQTAAKELAKPATYLLPPFGGGAVKKAIEGFATVKEGGSYTYDNQGNLQLQFPAYGQSPIDYAKAMLFGKWSSDEAQQYVDSGFKGLSADETSAYNNLRDNMGVNPRDAMEAILSIRGFESVKDAEGNTLQTVKEQQRMALFDNETLTPEQKAAIDSVLIVSGEDEMPADYTDRNSFILGQYINENRQDAARAALESGLTVDQFVQWDDRLKAIESMKDQYDKNRYTDAEARSMVLDEVMQDAALSDSEKQAVAQYVLISSMSDTQQEKWSAISGQVNASDFLRFKADVSEYEKEFSQSGADNAANVAQILRGYDNLTEEQRDVLFQTYSDNMSNNPFHVSVYEKNLSGNSFYSDLNDAGKAELRSLANEYEQAINEGKDLNDWQGKAYMAQEAGISPETYILYRVALSAANADGKGSAKQSEAETAVNLLPGLTQQQKAYLYQSTNTSWKANPFGSATVTKYNADTQEAINPVAGGTLSSSFGPRTSPTAGASSWHKAVDIAAPEGTPVQAVKSGKVTSSGWVDGYGWTVHIDHGDGTETEYHHMQGQSSLQPGDTVEQGQQIGAVGSTGISTGPHLDLQAWQDGKIVDPLTIIPEYGNASGYVYDGTVSAGVVLSGKQESSTKSGTVKKSTSLKGFDPFKAFQGF